MHNRELWALMRHTLRVLTAIEKEKVNKAFSFLSLLHQKVLKDYLHSISFMADMPNTALTSPVESASAEKMFNITFRADILNETISEWLHGKKTPVM